mgnify:CR=1 FL=1
MPLAPKNSGPVEHGGLPPPTFLQNNKKENCELFVSLKKALNQPVLKISFRRAWTIYTNILIFSKDTF